jgi:hypothetical protein
VLKLIFDKKKISAKKYINYNLIKTLRVDNWWPWAIYMWDTWQMDGYGKSRDQRFQPIIILFIIGDACISNFISCRHLCHVSSAKTKYRFVVTMTNWQLYIYMHQQRWHLLFPRTRVIWFSLAVLLIQQKDHQWLFNFNFDFIPLFPL